MRLLVVVLFLGLGLVACKKNESKAFLKGRLVDNCTGTPVANAELLFYQNFTKASTAFQNDIPEKLLETTYSDDNGYFYFYGKDYTTRKTSSISNSSIRKVDGTQVVVGNLGEGKGTNAGDFVNKDVGDIYFSGTEINILLNLPTSFNGVSYDSVQCFIGQSIFTLGASNIANGWFQTNFTGMSADTKYLSDMSAMGHNKMQMGGAYSFYANGTVSKYQSTILYITSCATGEAMYVELF